MARHKEFDPEVALRSARERFHRNGYSGSSMSQLLADMGIRQGSFYATFGSKKQLFERALEQYAEEIIGHLVRGLRDDEGSLDRVADLLLSAVGVYSGDPEQRGCFMVNTAVELAPHEPELSELLRKRWERLEAAMTRNLAAAQQGGQLRADASPRSLARMVIAVLHGLAVRSKYDPRPAALRDIVKTTLKTLR